MSLALTPAIHISNGAGATPCRARDLWLFFPVGDTQPHPLSAPPRCAAAGGGATAAIFTPNDEPAAPGCSRLLSLYFSVEKTSNPSPLCGGTWMLVQLLPPPPKPLGCRGVG